MSTERDENNRPTPYNGWRNYETWNVALWLTSDPDSYEMCKHHRDNEKAYADVVLALNARGITATPDGVALWSERLDVTALDRMITELP